MVVHAFPAAKLGVLLAKQISKPIAEFIKTRAKGHPLFRRYICIPPAQMYNWCEVKTKLWLLNVSHKNTGVGASGSKAKVVVPRLNEKVAIDLGANILGEAVIFFIGAGLLVLEYQRQVRKEERKELTRKDDLSRFVSKLYELQMQMNEQEEHIKQLYGTIRLLGEQNKVPKSQVPRDGTPCGIGNLVERLEPNSSAIPAYHSKPVSNTIVIATPDGNKHSSQVDYLNFNNPDFEHTNNNRNSLSSFIYYIFNEIFHLNKIFYFGEQSKQNNNDKDVFKKI